MRQMEKWIDRQVCDSDCSKRPTDQVQNRCWGYILKTIMKTQNFNFAVCLQIPIIKYWKTMKKTNGRQNGYSTE